MAQSKAVTLPEVTRWGWGLNPGGVLSVPTGPSASTRLFHLTAQKLMAKSCSTRCAAFAHRTENRCQFNSFTPVAVVVVAVVFLSGRLWEAASALTSQVWHVGQFSRTRVSTTAPQHDSM